MLWLTLLYMTYERKNRVEVATSCKSLLASSSLCMFESVKGVCLQFRQHASHCDIVSSIVFQVQYNVQLKSYSRESFIICMRLRSPHFTWALTFASVVRVLLSIAFWFVVQSYTHPCWFVPICTSLFFNILDENYLQRISSHVGGGAAVSWEEKTLDGHRRPSPCLKFGGNAGLIISARISRELSKCCEGCMGWPIVLFWLQILLSVVVLEWTCAYTLVHSCQHVYQCQF